MFYLDEVSQSSHCKKKVQKATLFLIFYSLLYKRIFIKELWLGGGGP
jgi:hypothetical protein